MSYSDRLQCLQRDNEQCVLTKAGEYNQVAHIYAQCLQCQLTGLTRDLFWASLDTFWPSEKIENWRHAILGENGTDHCANLITLSAHAHVYWGKGLFALKPIEKSQDEKELEAHFYWLRQYKHSTQVDPLFLPQHIFPHSSVGKHIKLFNCITDQKICSGDIVRFETTDPDKYPLPSFALLEMQWILQRVTALSGAAEQHDEVEDYDNHSNISVTAFGTANDFDIDENINYKSTMSLSSSVTEPLSQNLDRENRPM